MNRVALSLHVIMFGLFAAAMAHEIQMHNWGFALIDVAFALFYADLAWEKIQQP